ncbi:helix-turn-helix domain-containing protein [Nocardia crassostreae]|uniref:helix-turn-helix domain-containing protein n=1 Tax=Nocardia crassostreae TaxID=53428 RepID=UPI00082983B7|nr:AraC family transcriptional regulator [Nocardia crassostreae]
MARVPEVHRYGGLVLGHRECDWAGLSLERTRWRAFEGTTGDSRPRRHLLFVILAGSSGPVVARGAGQGRYRGADFPGAVTFIPAGCERSVVYGGGLIDCAALRIDPERFADLEVESSALDGFTNRPDPLLYRLALSLSEQAERYSVAGQLFADGVTTLIAARLSQIGGGRDRDRAVSLGPSALRRVVDYIDTHVDSDLRLAVLARLCGMDTFRFGRAFKAATGHTPHRYVLARRLDRAARLLRTDPGLPIADIAHLVGMSSQSHLTSAFRHEHGCTPAVYRDRHR